MCGLHERAIQQETTGTEGFAAGVYRTKIYLTIFPRAIVISYPTSASGACERKDLAGKPAPQCTRVSAAKTLSKFP